MTQSQCFPLDSTLSVIALSHVFLENNGTIVGSAILFQRYIKQAYCSGDLKGTRLAGESKKTHKHEQNIRSDIIGFFSCINSDESLIFQ